MEIFLKSIGGVNGAVFIVGSGILATMLGLQGRWERYEALLSRDTRVRKQEPGVSWSSVLRGSREEDFVAAFGGGLLQVVA
jgi:hypothetical protein